MASLGYKTGEKSLEDEIDARTQRELILMNGSLSEALTPRNRPDLNSLDDTKKTPADRFLSPFPSIKGPYWVA